MNTRILAAEQQDLACYHVYSRIVGGEFLLHDEEKEHFRRIMEQLLSFCGLEALAWCCLSNHFHILLTTPNGDYAQQMRDEIGEDALFSRMKIAFSEQYIQEVRWRVNHFRSQSNEAGATDIIERIKKQMFDISKFMHMLKRRFSAWYNKKHNRRGTLWESRYGSVLVEGKRDALMTMATYIDLNPVRAGLVADPKDYRWCGYAEALAGKKRAKNAIRTAVGDELGLDGGIVQWKEAIALYRTWLFGRGEEQFDESGKTTRRGVSREQVEAVWSQGGKLSRRELLHCRVRYLTKGVAIGSRGFVNGVFEARRDFFSSNRKSGARTMRFGDWGELCSMRDLRNDVIRAPG